MDVDDVVDPSYHGNDDLASKMRMIECCGRKLAQQNSFFNIFFYLKK